MTNETFSLLHLLNVLVPSTSCLFWALMMLVAAAASRTPFERKVKVVLLWYYVAALVAWVTLVLYTYRPELFAVVQVGAYFSYIVTFVIFYHFIFILTEANNETFDRRHYWLPLIICGVLGVWSLMVPFDVQVRLAEGRGRLVEGYKAYSVLYLSKPVIRMVFNMVYIVLSLRRLRIYYRQVNRGRDLIQRPVLWIILLMSFYGAMFLLSIGLNVGPRELRLNGVFTILSAASLVSMHVVMGYNVMRRNFLLYVPRDPSVASRHLPFAGEELPGYGNQSAVVYSDNPTNSTLQFLPCKGEVPACRRRGLGSTPEGGGGRSYTKRTPLIRTKTGDVVHKKLTRKDFEAYFRKNKPFLNAQLKITDLLEPLETNRTQLSAFINKTYGVNFNRYINDCRLQELERLMKQPVNAGKEQTELILKAGFSSRRNYLRAVEATQPPQNTEAP